MTHRDGVTFSRVMWALNRKVEKLQAWAGERCWWIFFTGIFLIIAFALITSGRTGEVDINTGALVAPPSPLMVLVGWWSLALAVIVTAVWIGYELRRHEH